MNLLHERTIPPFFKESSRLWQEIMSIDGAAGPGKEAFGDQQYAQSVLILNELAIGKQKFIVTYRGHLSVHPYLNRLKNV